MKPLNLCIVFQIFILSVWAVSALKNSTTTNNKFVRNFLLNKAQCTDAEQVKTEYRIARMVSIGKHGRPFPESFDQLKGFCRDTITMIGQVERFFKDCYKKQVRDMANLLIYSVKSTLRRYCSKKRPKAVVDLIKVAQCANKHLRLQIPCLEQFANQTKPVINIDDDQQKIPHACCNYGKAIKCANDFLDNVPCIRKHKGTIMEFIQGLTGSVVGQLCGDYTDDSDRCDKLGEPKPKQKNKRQYVSFAFVLLDMIESIKDLDAVH